MTETLRELADALGIVRGFAAIDGSWQATGIEAIRALAAALGYPAESEAEAAASLAALRVARSARRVPDYRVVEAGSAFAQAHPDDRSWSLIDVETRRVLTEGRDHEVAPGGLPVGRYRLRYDGDPSPGTLLLVRPRPRDDGRARSWGVMAPLYGLRSQRNAGLGDYRDLAELAAVCGEAGADFLGVNPVHALRSSDAAWFSPYSPNHRGFWNTRHLALDRVDGFEGFGGARAELAAAEPGFAALRTAATVDYARIDAARGPVLRALHRDFAALPAEARPRRRFQAWRRRQGAALRRFAIYEALLVRYGNDPAAWPAGHRHAGDHGVAGFAAAEVDEIGFHEWLQYEADRQLAAAAVAAEAAGQRIGLYFDIAVGTVIGSAEAWADPDAFVSGVSIGAPPDHFNPQGQAWHLAPLHPHRMMDADGEPLVTVLRTAMRHAGMVRIDHVLGFNRTFWAPLDGTPGSYVHYPFDGLLALLAIEAERAGAVVVGEDLGLVPDGFRERLHAEGILGCTVMQFERGADAFHDPAGWRRRSIGCVATHDVPPLRGWWSGTDIEAMRVAGLVDDDGARRMGEERARARAALWRLLAVAGLLGSGPESDPGDPPDELDAAAVRACHRLLARSPVQVAALQLDDILGVSEQQNLPGTVHEHPNWRRRLPVDITALAGDAEWRATCASLRTERPRPRPA